MLASVPDADTTREHARVIAGLVILGAVLRLLVRWIIDTRYPGGGAYTFYFDIAHNFRRGDGLCMFPGQDCARRMPLYPLFLALFTDSGVLDHFWVVAQATLGASLAWLTYGVGRELVGAKPAVWAAVATTISPYALVHDTALQDTVLINVLAVGAVWLLLRLRRSESVWSAILAGLAVSALVLTSARMALVIPVALGWVFCQSSNRRRVRWRQTVMVALPVIALIGGWMLRNASLLGAPVLTTESGESLWAANSAVTMTAFPIESIDQSVRAAYSALTPADSAALARVRTDEVEVNRVLTQLGWRFIVAHPILTAWRAMLKVAVPVLAFFSPVRSLWVQFGFAVAYLPLHIAAVVGLWRLRHRWRDHALVYGMFGAFFLTTGIYWSHTSHASWLDPFWAVYAAAAVLGIPAGRNPGATISEAHAKNPGHQ
jgi:hypothetical protein